MDQLAKASKQSVANASQHLQALHAAGLLTRERDGTRVRYELAGDDVLRLWLALRDTSAQRLAEEERSARNYLGEEVEAIDRDELLKRMRRRDVVLVDVRPADEFEAGHIEGAGSIPLAELERHLDELPSDREVIAYCRGPFCVMAHEAVHRLRAAGSRPPPRRGLARVAPGGAGAGRSRMSRTERNPDGTVRGGGPEISPAT